jgi:hypothetical protein
MNVDMMATVSTLILIQVWLQHHCNFSGSINYYNYLGS